MNSDWQWVQLGEISEVISKGTTPTTHGVAFLDSGIPFLRAEDVVGGAVDVNSVKYYIDEKTHNKLLSRSQLQPGDFLITIAGSLGRVGYVPLNAPPLNCNQAVAFVRLKPNTIDLNFLLYVFQYEGITKSLLDVQKVGTIGNLNLEQIRDFQIPLPPLTEQKRIASLLARADRLRGLRRAAREQCDSLLQSVFLEMFGDAKYDVQEFKGVIKIDRTAANEDDIKILPYVGLEDVEKDTGDFAKEYRPIPQSMLATNYKFTPSHVLYGKLRPYLNKVVMPSFSGVCTTEILPLLPIKGKTNKAYLWAYLRSKKFVDWASNNVSGANLPRLSPELLGDYLLPVPPLALQDEFARVVARVESLRARMDESARQGEALFQSLLAESFG